MRRLLAVIVVAGAAGVAAAAVSPSPITQPPLDGCARNPALLTAGLAPPLVYVYGSALPQWLSGVVAGVTPGDDLDLDVAPDEASSSLLAVGSSRLRAVRDATALPTFAWPDTGDRVQALGSWVWDCTRWKPAGERTELDPLRALWVQRATSAASPWGEREGDLFVSTDGTEAAAVADCSLQAKGDQTVYTACLPTEPRWQNVSGGYRFVLPAPPKPPGAATLRARVVDRGSVGGAAPAVVVRGSAAVVTLKLLTPPGTALAVAEQVFLGWSKVPATELPQHLRLAFRSFVSLGDSADTLAVDAAGLWGPVAPGVTVDLYLPRGAPWGLTVHAPSGTATARFTSPAAALGLHRMQAKGFALSYVVTRVNDALKRAASQPR